MSFKQQILKNVFWVYFFSYIAAPLGYLTRIILSRNMSIEDFGLLYAVLGFLGIIGIFTDMGLSETIAYYGTKYYARKDFQRAKTALTSVVLSQFIVSSIAAVILTILSSPLATIYFKSDIVKAIIPWFCIYFILSSIFIPIRMSFMMKMKPAMASFVEFLRTSMILVASCAIFFSPTAITIAKSWTIAIIVSLCIATVLFYKEFKEFTKEKIKFNWTDTKNYFSYSFQIFISYSASLLLTGTDLQIITILGSLNAVAQYSNAIALANVLLLLVGPMSTVLFPLLSKLSEEKESQKISNTISLFYNWFGILGIPILSLLISYPQEILYVFFGEAYAGAAKILLTLMIGFFFGAIGASNFTILSGLGMIRKRNKIIITTAIFNFIGSILLMLLIGVIGVAIMTATSQIIIFIWSTAELKKEVQFHIAWKKIAKIVIINIILTIGVFFAKTSLNLNYVVEAVIIGTVYLLLYIALIFLTKVVEAKDIKEILN